MFSRSCSRLGPGRKKRSAFHEWKRRAIASRVLQSFHTTDDIDPFSKYQWIAHPFQSWNMPQVAPDARPHKSLKAISHYDESKGWFHIIDCKGWGVGRLGTRVASLLSGKHRPDVKHRAVHGDSVILVNAIHVTFPGHTWDTKMYRFKKTNRWTDPRGPKFITAKRLFYLNPSMIMNLCVKRMLANHYMKNTKYRKLLVYPGAIHPHWGIPQVIVPVRRGEVSRAAASGPRDTFDITAEDGRTQLAVEGLLGGTSSSTTASESMKNTGLTGFSEDQDYSSTREADSSRTHQSSSREQDLSYRSYPDRAVNPFAYMNGACGTSGASEHFASQQQVQQDQQDHQDQSLDPKVAARLRKQAEAEEWPLTDPAKLEFRKTRAQGFSQYKRGGLLNPPKPIG
ncbi:unnamed protein product [Amoebophrya sp. A25]|nr:unnamed protein product [Amoebophrya sp. A25]|eukprot:GSA25T00022068001.1